MCGENVNKFDFIANFFFNYMVFYIAKARISNLIYDIVFLDNINFAMYFTRTQKHFANK